MNLTIILLILFSPVLIRIVLLLLGYILALIPVIPIIIAIPIVIIKGKYDKRRKL